MKAAYTRIGWKTLRADINQLVDAINANQPVEGAGIRIRDGAAGKVIETATTEGNSLSGGGGSGGQVVWHGVAWQNVDVVDSKCNRSTITVLVYTGNAGDSIVIT